MNDTAGGQTAAQQGLRERINAALKAAIKDQDKRRMATFRLINAAIKDRDIAARSNGKDGVSDAEIRDILSRMIRQRRDSIKFYEEAGRLELAEQEQEEIAIIEEFLPKQMTEAEIARACEETVAELGASGLKDMGRVMSALREKYAGQMDFATASQIVKKCLK